LVQITREEVKIKPEEVTDPIGGVGVLIFGLSHATPPYPGSSAHAFLISLNFSSSYAPPVIIASAFFE
jgi:hypothetical protein